MPNFYDRELAFETKFAHDEELKFRIEAHATKLIALWAAELMQLQNGAKEEYVQSLLQADLGKGGLADVAKKLQGDLRARGMDCKSLRLEKKIAERLETARREVEEGIAIH